MIKIKVGVEAKLKTLLQKTNRDQVNSIDKLWIYENHIVSRILWQFIIYCFSYFLRHGPSNIGNMLPQGQVCQEVQIHLSYKKRENKGLQLMAFSTHLVVKYHIVKYAVDSETQFVYGHMAWNDVKELHERENHLHINKLCRG